MKGTRERWQFKKKKDFLLIYHEHLLIFRKPSIDEDVKKYRYSMKNFE
jgi:hypothetical protein